jgi:hypothetical protein
LEILYLRELIDGSVEQHLVDFVIGANGDGREVNIGN